MGAADLDDVAKLDGLAVQGVLKVLYLHEAEQLRDLRVPPGNRLEALRGDRAGWFSRRINDQWRVVFRWEAGQALHVSIVDYH